MVESSIIIQELIRGKDPEGRRGGVVIIVAEYRTRQFKSNMDDKCGHLDPVIPF